MYKLKYLQNGLNKEDTLTSLASLRHKGLQVVKSGGHIEDVLIPKWKSSKVAKERLVSYINDNQ